MFFGLPWFAVVAIVAIVGGLFVRYREQELEMETKSRSSFKELNELRNTVQSLKTRVENLEAIVTEVEDTERESERISMEEDQGSEQEERSTSEKKKTH